MKLPHHVDPRKLAIQGTHLRGSIPPAELGRLARAVVRIGEAEADLVFSRDEDKRTVIDGEYSLAVTMSCQRCLQPVAERIEGEFHVGVVGDENRAAELPRWLDPWLVDGESGDLYGLLEDEFLLSLPIAPFHEETECTASGSYSTGEAEEEGENPFSILAKLKK